MLKFVKWAFRSFFEVLLWFNFAACVITGGVAGYLGGQYGQFFGDGESVVWQIGRVAVGVIIGALAGAITNILFGGLVATFLEIGNEVAEIKSVNAKIQADMATLRGAAADIRTSTAETAAVFQKMANRNAPGGGA